MCFPFPQAALRQKELEKSVQWAQENDKTLRQIQDSLANADRHLTAYLADHIDAQQIPQEAQVARQCVSVFVLQESKVSNICLIYLITFPTLQLFNDPK